MRKQFKLMTDADNRTFFKDGLNRHQYYTDNEGDMHCIETFLNVYTDNLNEQHQKIKGLEKQLKLFLINATNTVLFPNAKIKQRYSGIHDECSVIDFETNEKLCRKDILIRLNEQDNRIKELKQNNDMKFWKLQFMQQYNKTTLITTELDRAIRQGYEISDKFQKYLDDLKEFNREGMQKANEQDTW